MQPVETTDPLVGLYVVYVNTVDDTDWEGTVVAAQADGSYLIDLHADGGRSIPPGRQVEMHLRDLAPTMPWVARGCGFFPNSEAADDWVDKASEGNVAPWFTCDERHTDDTVAGIPDWEGKVVATLRDGFYLVDLSVVEGLAFPPGKHVVIHSRDLRPPGLTLH